MGGRYMRKFVCDDCGTPTERMWQGGRPKICYPCAQQRWLVATDAAHEAVEEHKRTMRLELAARRAVAPADAPEGLAAAFHALERFSGAQGPSGGE